MPIALCQYRSRIFLKKSTFCPVSAILSHSRKSGQLVKLIPKIKTSTHHETNPPEIQCRIQDQGRP